MPLNEQTEIALSMVSIAKLLNDINLNNVGPFY